MDPRLIQWYFCQLVIKYAIRRDTPCSKADTLLRLRGARSRFRTGGIPFGVLLIIKLAGVGVATALTRSPKSFSGGVYLFISKFIKLIGIKYHCTT